MAFPARTTAIVALFGALMVADLHAQQPGAGREGCDLVRSRRLNSILTDAGERITYISGPLAFQCEDGTRIRADSVVDFESTRFRRLMGGVEIDGPDTRLVARRVHQSDDAGRIEAWGSVEVEQKGSDTRMVGDSLVFLESGPSRALNELTVMGERPIAVLRLGGEAAGEEPVAQPPDTVFADRLHMEGESRFVATGSVRVRRTEMDAFADSLDFDRDRNVANLFGTLEDPARIDGEEFDLAARRVDLHLREGDLDEILAVDGARLTGEDVEMEAPRIRIFMSDGEMDRLVAVREGSGETATEADGAARAVRPEATADDFVLQADSIEVAAPRQRLDRVFAVGGARGESLGRDSLNAPGMPEVIRRDWIEGDTIVAHFIPTNSVSGEVGDATDTLDAAETVDPADTIDPAVDASDSAPAVDEQEPTRSLEVEGDAGPSRPEYRLDRLVATGNARSLYRLAPRDTVSVVSVDEEGGEEEDRVTGGGASDDAPSGGGGAAAPDSAEAAGPARERRRPAVHYVMGSRITIVLQEGAVERMEVQGQTRGIYLEPVVVGPAGSGDESPSGGAPPEEAGGDAAGAGASSGDGAAPNSGSPR